MDITTTMLKKMFLQMTMSTTMLQTICGRFSNCKDKFLVYPDGHESFLVEKIENGPYIPKPTYPLLKTFLAKPQKQWTPKDRKHANQDKRPKSIIISSVPNDKMKSVIRCKTTKEMWNDLILGHEGSSETRDSMIAALRLMFKGFKALEGEKVQQTYTRIKILLNDLENKDVKISQAEDSEFDVEDDTRSSLEFLSDLNQKFHDRALLANHMIFYKTSGIVGAVRKYKGLVVESYVWDDEELSFWDEGLTTIKAFMAIAKDEPSKDNN
ncbi:hypothetical protein Tco_1110589 [Tanacetum coccineum]|uniref:Uncharacterized protein n=1 Tax=Tanacetum coccineum TaxID=301880 RepID=A0ABQ5IJ83_9ASTR